MSAKYDADPIAFVGWRSHRYSIFVGGICIGIVTLAKSSGVRYVRLIHSALDALNFSHSSFASISDRWYRRVPAVVRFQYRSKAVREHVNASAKTKPINCCAH